MTRQLLPSTGLDDAWKPNEKNLGTSPSKTPCKSTLRQHKCAGECRLYTSMTAQTQGTCTAYGQYVQAAPDACKQNVMTLRAVSVYVIRQNHLGCHSSANTTGTVNVRCPHCASTEKQPRQQNKRCQGSSYRACTSSSIVELSEM